MPKWDKVSIAGTSKSLEWKLSDFLETSKSRNLPGVHLDPREPNLSYAVFGCKTSGTLDYRAKFTGALCQCEQVLSASLQNNFVFLLGSMYLSG